MKPTYNWTRNAAIILTARSPNSRIALKGTSFDENAWHVELADYPRWPDWQFCELGPAFYIPPWLTPTDSRWQPVAERETAAACKVGVDLANALIRRLRSDPLAYQSTRSEFRGLWLHICLGTANAATRRGAAVSDVDRLMLATMAIFNLVMLCTTEGSASTDAPVHAQVDSDKPFIRSLQANGEHIRGLLRDCLARIGVPQHRWTEMVALGLLMHPYGSTWVQTPLNLGPKTGPSELERTIEVALGVPDFVYRTANKLHRSYLRAQGFEHAPRRPGPKRGSRRRPAKDWVKFETKVIALRKSGVSPRFICENAEAQKLYRQAKRDSQAILNERTVRRVLRKRLVT